MRAANIGIGTRTLFRLEEYKLPEFKVTVRTPEESGQGVRQSPPPPEEGVPPRRQGRGDDPGGLLLRRPGGQCERRGDREPESLLASPGRSRASSRGSTRTWMKARQPLAAGIRRQGQIIKRETLKTDATGKATLALRNAGECGSGFRVSHRGARDRCQPARDHRQRQRARDAAALLRLCPRPSTTCIARRTRCTWSSRRSTPTSSRSQIEGKVKVTRDYWWEIWIEPDGTRSEGGRTEDDCRRDVQDLAAAARAAGSEGLAAQVPRLRARRDPHAHAVKTDTNGDGACSSSRRSAKAITASRGRAKTACSNLKSSDLTSRSAPRPPSGSPTTRPPNSATATAAWRSSRTRTRSASAAKRPVMLVANSPDRYVLFTVEGEDLAQLPARSPDRHGEAGGSVRRGETRAQHLPRRSDGERPADLHGHQTGHRAADEEFPDRGREA